MQRTQARMAAGAKRPTRVAGPVCRRRPGAPAPATGPDREQWSVDEMQAWIEGLADHYEAGNRLANRATSVYGIYGLGDPSADEW